MVWAFYGGAQSNIAGITIQGDSSGGTTITGGVGVYSCEAPVFILDLTITGNANKFNMSVLNNAGYFKAERCKCIGTTTRSGIWIQRTLADLYNCEISNKTEYGLLVMGSLCFATAISGSGNNICIQAGRSISSVAGILIGDNHTITGTTKYAKECGGIIFAGGTLV